MGNKFNIGDKVVGNKKNPYPITCKGWVGEVVDVSGIEISVEGEWEGVDVRYWVNPEYFDLVTAREAHKIVITTDGRTTLARLYENNKVIKRAEAQCSPDDEFNFNVGAELALSRLMGKPATDKPEYYNGKVVCVKTCCAWWTVGKVYEVKDGVITCDTGRSYPRLHGYRYKNAEDVRYAGCTKGTNYNSDNEFVPLIEE